MKQNRGNIINIVAASAHRCYVMGGASGPSKAGVVSLTKHRTVERGKYNICVNGVSPRPIMTEESQELIQK